MRHRKRTFKIGRTGSHRRALLANMAKSLIVNDRIETTVTKAKELRRFAERMITLSKRHTIAAERQAIAKMQVRFNNMGTSSNNKEKINNTLDLLNKIRELSSKSKRSQEDEEKLRALKERFNAIRLNGSVNNDRLVIPTLKILGERFKNRAGGYTRITRTRNRRGDAADMCILEFLT